MNRAVLDTNVVASGLLGLLTPKTSVPGQILRLWRRGAFVIVSSDHIFWELERTLLNPYFRAQMTPSTRARLMAVLHAGITMQPSITPISPTATHPEDDLVIAAALSAQVPWLVTGDKQLLRLEAIADTRIITGRTFLTMLEAGELPSRKP